MSNTLFFGFAAWGILSCVVGLLVGRRLRKVAPPLAAPLSIPVSTGHFKVVQTLVSGAKARQLFERGTPGAGETLSLYDGDHRRGVKNGPATEV